KSRAAVRSHVHESVGDAEIDRILCIPYFTDDVLNALALHEISGAPMCAYLMDDQNLYAEGIANNLMRQLLEKSTLRLAISRELVAEYGAKYGVAMNWMPPLAPASLIPVELNAPSGDPLNQREAILVGNIWGIAWVQLLRAVLRKSGLVVRWCNRG